MKTQSVCRFEWRAYVDCQTSIAAAIYVRGYGHPLLVMGVLATLRTPTDIYPQHQHTRSQHHLDLLRSCAQGDERPGQEGRKPENHLAHLGNWRSSVVGQYRQAWNKLIIRLRIVALIITLLAAISEASRRVAVRHVEDPNRRRLIAVARRALTVFMILMVAVFGFASHLRSLATYFGLLTAGVAVALENVILATVGYLLLVGKRGIRIGDWVQISGVTGDVIDMDLLQFQLREFDPQKRQFTGHAVTFSKSLVFVSPATGLMRFYSDHVQAARPEVENIGREPNSRERGSAAGAKS